MTNESVTAVDLLLDGFGRVQESVHAAVAGLDRAQLSRRISPDANPAGWLVWHLSRVQDDHVAEVAGVEQRWTADGWNERFGLPYDDSSVGYGQSSAEVGQFEIADPAWLTGYYDAVHAATSAYLGGLTPTDLARVVDDSWDPPVTLAARLVSVLNDDTQHVGQAAYLRGVLQQSS